MHIQTQTKMLKAETQGGPSIESRNQPGGMGGGGGWGLQQVHQMH
jgi:hypothetical protein